MRLLALLLALFAPALALAKPLKAALAPGEVAEAHAPIEGACEKCHLVYKGVPNERCLVCHVAIEARSRDGFHATVKDKRCIDCHTDHLGRGASMTKASAKSAFDHQKTRFPLGGAHAEPACGKCHERPLEEVTPACGGCHQDPHKGSLGSRCEACHGADLPSWKDGLKTREAHKTSLAGGHAKLDCAGCHKSGQALKAEVPCRGCHELAHGGTKAACDVCHQVEAWKPAKFEHSVCTCRFPGKHLTFSCEGCHPKWKFTDTPTLCSGCHLKERKHEANGECSLCHTATSWKKRDVFDHNKRSTFAIDGEHLNVDCARCHTTQGKWKGTPRDCKSCHSEQGMTAHGDFGDCARCHDTRGFDRSSFDHASTGFSLTGKHAKAKCQSCHAEKTKGYPARANKTSFLYGARVWLASAEAPHASTDGARCGHCHEDPHPGGAGAECSDCHATEAWRPSTFGLERHAATKLPLRGEHQALKCAACHLSGELRGQPSACNGCHFDQHKGRLGASCEECHSEKGWKPVPSFDHGRTGFSLAGVHAGPSCEACHAGARGAALDVAKEPAACATCHAPGHGDLGPDCARCHTTELVEGRPVPFAKARASMRFDHDETGFPLERRHAIQPCGACHLPKGPRPSAQCGDCHADVHAGQLGPRCEECHRPDRFRLARFDHDRAGWPLRGRHFVTPCLSCHTSARWVGLGTECYDCHALDAARAKQLLPAIHGFAAANLDCKGCHRSLWRW